MKVWMVGSGPHPAGEATDLLDRVDDRRVVLVVELSTDLRVGEVRQLFAEVHRHLPRKGELFGVRAALDFADLQPVVARDELDDLGGRRSPTFFGEDVAKRLLVRSSESARPVREEKARTRLSNPS